MCINASNKRGKEKIDFLYVGLSRGVGGGLLSFSGDCAHVCGVCAFLFFFAQAKTLRTKEKI